MICLDSSFIVDILRRRESALKKLKELREEEIFATAISEYEILNGAYLGDCSNEKIKNISSFFNSVAVHNFDSNAALIAAEIRSDLIKHGKEIEENDCMIIGTAISNNCKTIITNDNQFKRINELKVINY